MMPDLIPPPLPHRTAGRGPAPVRARSVRFEDRASTEQNVNILYFSDNYTILLFSQTSAFQSRLSTILSSSYIPLIMAFNKYFLITLGHHHPLAIDEEYDRSHQCAGGRRIPVSTGYFFSFQFSVR